LLLLNFKVLVCSSYENLTDTEIAPNFTKYINELRTGRDTEKEFRLFCEELKNSGLGAATMKNLSEISSARTSSGRGDPMIME
jgi:hypothetical protein